MNISLNSFLKKPLIQERIPPNLTNFSHFLCVQNCTSQLSFSNYPSASHGPFETMSLQECHPSQSYLVVVLFHALFQSLVHVFPLECHLAVLPQNGLCKARKGLRRDYL